MGVSANIKENTYEGVRVFDGGRGGVAYEKSEGKQAGELLESRHVVL